MTQSIESMIEVLQAYQAGKKIEGRDEHTNEWRECNDPPYFNFGVREYRIAPEPKKKVKLEAWLSCIGELRLLEEGHHYHDWIRVPSEDKEILI